MSSAPALPRPDPVTLAQITTLWDGQVLLCSISDAAKLLGVARGTVHDWIRKDLVQVRYLPSGRKRVVVSSLWRDTPPGEMRAQLAAAEARARAMTRDRLAAAGADPVDPTADPAADPPTQPNLPLDPRNDA